jgi:hypothetical protein
MTILATSFGSPSQFSTHTIIVDTVERAPVCGSRRGQSASFAEPQFWRPWISNTAFGHDAILAVDIGGTNIRAGIVCLNLDDAEDLSKAEIGQFELWRHGDEKASRQEAIDGLIGMLKRLNKAAKQDKLGLAPFIGIGCRGALMPTSQLRPAARICRAIGRAAVSACQPSFTRPSPKSTTTIRRS